MLASWPAVHPKCSRAFSGNTSALRKLSISETKNPCLPKITPQIANKHSARFAVFKTSLDTVRAPRPALFQACLNTSTLACCLLQGSIQSHVERIRRGSPGLLDSTTCGKTENTRSD